MSAQLTIENNARITRIAFATGPAVRIRSRTPLVSASRVGTDTPSDHVLSILLTAFAACQQLRPKNRRVCLRSVAARVHVHDADPIALTGCRKRPSACCSERRGYGDVEERSGFAGARRASGGMG